MKNPPSKEELRIVLNGVGITPLELIRKREKVFKELELSKNDVRSAEEWIDIMVKYPVLIERPILIYNNKIALGRPIEELSKILL